MSRLKNHTTSQPTIRSQYHEHLRNCLTQITLFKHNTVCPHYAHLRFIIEYRTGTDTKASYHVHYSSSYMQWLRRTKIRARKRFILVFLFISVPPLHHHHHLPPWIRSFEFFRHRRVAIVSWGVHDLFFLEVCSWGRVSGVWCCPFFQDGWSSFVYVCTSTYTPKYLKLGHDRFHSRTLKVKVKLSVSPPRRRMGEWMYISTYS